MESKILRYDDVRGQIRNGDIFMYKGKAIFSSIIQWVTHSPYSHAGVAAWWNERLMVMEARSNGVVASSFSRSIGRYKGEAEWFSCVKEISDEDRLRMVIFAQEELGKSYGRWKTILLGFRTLLEWDLDKRDRLRAENKLFCSEYVARIYNSIGLDLKRKRSDRFMKPVDIANSPLLEKKGKIKIHPTKRDI